MVSCNGTTPGIPVRGVYDFGCESLLYEEYFECNCDDDDDEDEDDDEECSSPSEYYSQWTCETSTLGETNFTINGGCGSMCDDCTIEYPVNFSDMPWTGDWGCFTPDGNTYMSLDCFAPEVQYTVYIDTSCTTARGSSVLPCEQDCLDDSRRLEVNEHLEVKSLLTKNSKMVKMQEKKLKNMFKMPKYP
eukprot:CAMPEP_0185760436 /NCGR_PEP_ID=MMETSP1174-20130828/19301_1 /TAXON_ID=35687 /ORGANISM="Dictyocha speculum, Strain CCMP1381" /LENGTH=188 /DNA_ID=CAMNT_0028441249 /DNA_START=242 /DNA_END=808 /DNA_ORIENTATION=+